MMFLTIILIMHTDTQNNRNVLRDGRSMVSSTTATTIITYLLVLSSTPSQTGGFLSPKRRKATEHKKSTKMNESQSSLFSPNSKYHNQNGLAKRRRWLIVDFDGTCTEHDTTPLLPRLASFATRSRSSISKASDGTETKNNGDYDHQEDLKKRLDQFQLLEDEFMKRYNEARSKMFNGENDESSTSLYDVLDALDEPSNAVTEMVSASKCLSGLGHADTDEIEQMLNLHGVTRETTLENANISENNSDDKVTVKLRHGCESTLSRILLDDKASTRSKDGCEEDDRKCYGWRLAVLSINWSPKLIDACLVQPVLRRRRSLLRIESCDTEVPIWSNEVDREGVVTLHVPGALAKRDRLIESSH